MAQIENQSQNGIFKSNTSIGTPIKRQRLSDWIRKQGTTICSLQGIHFKYKEQFKSKSTEKDTLKQTKECRSCYKIPDKF